MKRHCWGSLLLGLLCLSMAQVASAHGNIWLDTQVAQDTRATQFKKIVIFPLSDAQSAVGRPDQYGALNANLAERLKKRIKGTNFLYFEDPTDARAADKRQEKELLVRAQPGPHGDEYKRHYHSWHEAHLIPEATSTLQMLDVDFTLYDAYTQQKALTLIDYYRCYDVDVAHAFAQVAKNFAGDWYRLKKSKAAQPAAGAPTLSCHELTLPEATAQDEFAVKTIDYAFTDEALTSLKHVRVKDAAAGSRYYVTGRINTYERGERWVAPSASTSTQLDWTETFTWYDSDNKEHTGKRKYYSTAITDHYGHNTFYYHVNATLQLVDSLTGQTALERRYDREDAERYANALRDMFGDFYREIDKTIGVQGNDD